MILRSGEEAYGGTTPACAMPEVKGIAFGALGEFSNSVNVLIDGFAHEGALKNPDRFGQSNYKAAYGVTHWWLKRR